MICVVEVAVVVLAQGTLEAIPGDPAALYAAADEMDGAARDFADAADAIGAHGRAVTANWYGDASEAAGNHIRGLSTRVRVGDDVYAGVAKVIRTYAAALAAAQDAWSEATTRASAASTALDLAHRAAGAAAAMPTTDASGQVDQAAASAQATAAQDAAAGVRSAGAALDAAQEDMAAAVAAAVAAALAANTDAARQVQAFTDQLAAMGGQAAVPTSTTSGAAAVALAEGVRVTGASYDGVQQGWDGSIEWADDDAGGGQSWWDSLDEGVRDVLGEAQAQVQSVLDFYRDNPDVLARTVRDAGLTALGAVLLAEGVGGELGGAALDATGVGALAGVPINIAEAGVIAAGAGSALVGGVGLSQDLKAVLEGRQVPDPRSALDDGTMAAQHSAVLGKNLEASGVVRPAGTAAHHIVAWNSPAAAPARAVLQKFGIGIDDADNGVFLPRDKTSPYVASGSSVHASLHTDEYYAQVNQALKGARTRAQAEQALDDIRVALQNGWAPR